MKDELISFETAKLAKEKGFNIDSGNCFDEKQNRYSWDMLTWFNDSENKHLQFDETLNPIYYRPTQSLLQKWFREIHDINIWAYQPNISGYWGHSLENKARYDTYEEALERGLEEGLNLIQ